MEIERLSVLRAVAVFAISLALLIVMSPLAVWPAAYGLIQLVAIAMPALVATRGRPEPLGLRWPRPGAFAGALLLGATTWYLVLVLCTPLLDWLGERWQVFDPSRLAELERLVAGMPWPLLLLSLVAAPAVCEEILFRGVLARAFTGAVGAVWAIVFSAVLFGLFHLEPIRMIPTALLGLVVGYAAITSRSTVAAMTIHLLNNGIAVGVERLGTGVLDDHPAVFGGLAGVGFLVGIALIWRTRPV